MIVTIDGPAVSGKSSLAAILAKKLGFHHLQTGLLYRAVAYSLLRKIDCSDDVSDDCLQRLKDVLETQNEDVFVKVVESVEYNFASENTANVTVLGCAVTEILSDSRFSQPASLVSAHPSIRRALLPLQREIGARGNIIAEGRDCGSVVFPDADLKIFLTAHIDVRARRRINDPKRKSTNVTFEQGLLQIKERDMRDKNRALAPLIIPKGAVVIDNSNISLDETVQRVLALVKSVSA